MSLTKFLSMGLTHVSHDEMMAFLESYPWPLESRFNNAKQPSWAFWEPPSRKGKATLVAIKKFPKGYVDFESKGDCFILADPDYKDVHGREWRKFDGLLYCVIAVAGHQTESGETLSSHKLRAVAASNANCRFSENDRKLWFDMSVRKGEPPRLERSERGVVLKGA